MDSLLSRKVRVEASDGSVYNHPLSVVAYEPCERVLAVYVLDSPSLREPVYASAIEITPFDSEIPAVRYLDTPLSVCRLRNV